ncbi:MAG TPA: hypothetical protein QF564_21270 [Pirellulaceae bacterium]|nr:hypothetical protein [Pirellulaceae bacterium]
MRQAQPFLLRRSLPLCCAALLGCSLLLQPAHVLADASIDDVQIGFAGEHKTGYWTPVWITVSAGEDPANGRLDVIASDGRGLDVRSIDRKEISVRAGQTTTILRYVKIGRLGKGLTVEFHDRAQSVLHKRVSYVDRPLPVSSDAELVVSLGGDIGVAEALAHDVTAIDVTAVQIKQADRLPLDWFGYEGVDTIVITTRDNPLLDELSSQQTAAIRQWVEMGGQLVLCMGESGKQILPAPDDSPLKPLIDLVPGKFVRIATVTNAAALENYTDGGAAWPMTVNGRLRMTVLDQVQGNLELYDVDVTGRRPMVIRAPFGFGQVVFAAFDLDQPPLSNWEGRSRMVVKIIRGGSAQENRTAVQQQSGQVSHVGYHDMVGQLRGALDQFEGVSFVAFSVVATLILVYIVMIGPVDFFFLKNVLGRMQLTWVTFPIIVFGFVGLALILKAQLKGKEILVNQVDLIDVDAGTGLLRGTTWAHIYSPITETYDVALQPSLTRNVDAITTSLLSWQGMPGAGLGGLNSTFAAAAFSEPYVVSSGEAAPVIAGLPIKVASTTSISSRWWQQSKWNHTTDLAADVDGLLHGAVVNPLDVELHDCMIFFSVWAYHLDRTRGRLKPGQMARADDEQPRNLRWRLTRREVQEMKDVATPWDPTSFEVPRIMEMMMFQDVAGGDQYTKLSNRYQDYIDISSHLISGRAVLIGRIEERGSKVSVDGQTIDSEAGRHWTFCRIVFPVDRSKAQDD